MADNDRLHVALEEIRGNVLKAEGAGKGRDLNRVIYTHGLMTGTSRRLLAALEAALEEHRQSDSDTGWCNSCDFSWPCTTVQAIAAALLGED